MPRHRPPFREARPYFNFDARVWIAANRQGWTTAQINTTLETIWVGSTITRGRYMIYKMNHPNAPNSPGLPTPNPIPVHPYTRANLAASRISGRMPGVAAPSGFQAAPPPPPPPPAPVAPQTLALGPIQSLALTAGSMAEQSNPTYPFSFWPPPPWPAEPETENWPPFYKINSDVLEYRLEGIDEFLVSFGQDNPQAGADEKNWHGVKFLGAGSFGSAGLWVHTDENRNILRRQVIKDVQPQPVYWRDPTQWRDQLPREVRIHQLVDQHRKHRVDKNDHRKRDRKYLIKHYGHSLKMRSRRYRIYLKYYAGGDLESAIEWSKYDKGELSYPVIPEGFIWHVIESLVKACQVLRTGVVDPETLADEDKNLFNHWKPITHLDINMRNIFMEETRDQNNPRPQLVLSDFGMAFYSLSPSPGVASPPSDNPWAYQINDIITTWAPEHQANIVNPPVPLGEKTDVWLIGSTAWMLMAGNPMYDDEDGPLGPQREDIGAPHPLLVPVSGYPPPSPPYDRLQQGSLFPENTVYPRATGYSEDLKYLVAECLQWNMEDRINLRNLGLSVEIFKRNPGNAGIVNDMTPPPVKQDQDFWPKRGVLPDGNSQAGQDPAL